MGLQVGGKTMYEETSLVYIPRGVDEQKFDNDLLYGKVELFH